jgi:hypothetical protein
MIEKNRARSLCQYNNPIIQKSIYPFPKIRVHLCPSVVDLIGDENKRIALNVPSFPESKQHE